MSGRERSRVTKKTKLMLTSCKIINNVGVEEAVTTHPPKNCGCHGNEGYTKINVEETIHFASGVQDAWKLNFVTVSNQLPVPSCLFHQNV
jgi:hypothetical protein